jgi:hypothetical protein
MQNSLLPRANRLSTRKRDSKTNRKDALTAEEQESSREIITEAAMEATIIATAMAIGGK